MESQLQRETVTYNKHRMIAFRAAENLSPGQSISAATEDYTQVLATATNLPGRLTWLIKNLFDNQVVWRFRIVNDEIYLWLPQTHPAAGGAVSKISMVDMFCQVVSQTYKVFIEVPADWTDNTHQVKFQEGWGSTLGEVGQALAEVLDWACEE